MRQRPHVRCEGCCSRGSVAPLTAISMVGLLGFSALTVDVGLLYNARTELQRAADAAALAGASQLLDQDRLAGSVEMSAEIAAARLAAARTAALNTVLGSGPLVDSNDQNLPDGDLVIGYLNNPDNLGEVPATVNLNQANSVQVLVRRDSVRNGPVALTFARVLGFTSSNVSATATATFKDGVFGYRVTGETGNAELLPLALHVDAWNALLAGTTTTGDQYSYDSGTGVSSGSDGILELNLYPGAGPTQLPPGNFGTVDIGPPNNSTADISRQIRYGVNEEDLAYFGGELTLGADGTLLLQGDTGLSAGIKDDLTAIIGKPRAIPLFSTVAGPGNNAVFTVVGFAGIRILNVKLTGAMNNKNVIIQPAFVIDDSVITGPGSGASYFVYEPPRLTR